GLVSFAMATRTPATPAAEIQPALASEMDHAPVPRAAPVISHVSTAWPVYVTIAISGATALGAEVIWTRLLGLMLGATVYTFSIILAIFLVGLGIGSAGGAALARNLRTTLSARAVFGTCQLLLVLGIAWTAFML